MSNELGRHSSIQKLAWPVLSKANFSCEATAHCSDARHATPLRRNQSDFEFKSHAIPPPPVRHRPTFRDEPGNEIEQTAQKENSTRANKWLPATLLSPTRQLEGLPKNSHPKFNLHWVQTEESTPNFKVFVATPSYFYLELQTLAF